MTSEVCAGGVMPLVRRKKFCRLLGTVRCRRARQRAARLEWARNRRHGLAAWRNPGAHDEMSEELCFIPAIELALMIRHKTVSPVEVMRSTIARAQRSEERRVGKECRSRWS